MATSPRGEGDTHGLTGTDAPANQLDCNDNSPRLGPFTLQDVPLIDGSPTAMCHGGHLNQCDMAQNTHNITYSAEDTLNNDFFFDDEFALPFDATISDSQIENEFNNGSSQLIDSAEIDEIINREKRASRNMSTSKTDSCIYHADFENSLCSEVGDQNMSQELTPSDKDNSSSDVSGQYCNLAGRSGPTTQNKTINDSDLNNSFLGAEGKFDFDWKANKDQYMISFDKNMAKYSSDESSFCEGACAGRVLTTWARKRSESAWDSGTSSSGGSKTLEDSGKSKPCEFEVKLKKNQDKSTDNGSNQSSRSNMTTWKAVTSPGHSSDSGSDSDPMSMFPHTTGSADQVRTCNDEVDASGTQPRSHSLPDMKYNKLQSWSALKETNQHVAGSKSPESLSSDYKTCSEGGKMDTNVESQHSDDTSSSGEKRTSLLELFQKSKSQSGSDCSSNSGHHQKYYNLLSPSDITAVDVVHAIEEPVSPNSMRKLTGTWSMSTISSGRRSRCLSPDKDEQPDNNAPPNISLKRWGSSQNLPNLSEDLNPDSDADLMTESEGDLSVSGHSVQEEAKETGRTYLSRCTCDLSGCLDCSLQAGSGYLSDSYSNDKLDHSVQWPPCTCNTSIQTSLEYPGGNDNFSKKYKVVEAALQTHLKASRPYSSKISRMYSMPLVKKSPKQARDRLTQSMFIKRNSSNLPDLGFLHDFDLTASKVLRSTMSSPNLRQNYTKPSQLTSVEPVSVVGKRFSKRSLSTSPCSSRESSPSTAPVRRPRSNSASTNTSACSSSSSGIDPGYSSCDSQLNKIAHWFGDIPEHLLTQIPEWLVHRIAYSDRGLCVVCRVKLLHNTHSKDSIASVNSSHLESDKGHSSPSQPTSGAFKDIKNIKKPLIAKNPIAAVSKSDTNEDIMGAVKLRNKISSEKKEERPMSVPNMETLYEEPVVEKRPLKSCLRRNSNDKKKLAMKHRSWSDPFDATVLRYSQNGEIRYQLVTHVQKSPCTSEHDSCDIKGAYSGACDSVEFHKAHNKLKDTSPTKCPQSNLTKRSEECIREINNILATCCNTINPACNNGGKGHLLFGQSTADCCQSSSNSSNSAGVSHSSGSADTVINRCHNNEGVELKISPDRIQVPACGCSTTHAVLHSSSDSGDSGDSTMRNKKSVKFSEKIFYHSPADSPHQSPKRRVTENRVTLGVSALGDKRTPLNRDMLFKLQDNTTGDSTSSDQGSPPPVDFFVGDQPPDITSMNTSATHVQEMEQQILAQKKSLVCAVSQAADTLIYTFTKANTFPELERAASTKENPELGHMILNHLCPALITLVTDDINQSVRSLFGKVKNTPWRLVEELVEQGNCSRVLVTLVKDLQNLDFLDTAWLKFNAFIFGLLNHRALDFWLTYLCNHEKFVTNNYKVTSFVSLSQTAARQHFLHVITSLQPLAKIPFKLEYDFEYRHLRAVEREALSSELLARHTNTSSTDARLEHLLQLQHSQQMESSEKQASQTSPQSRRSNSPLRDSIQELVGETLRHPVLQNTKDKTKSLLTFTGQQIKTKFRQIQRQSKETGLSQSGEGIGPMKVSYSSDYDVSMEGLGVEKDSQISRSEAIKDDAAIGKMSQSQDSMPRSQSLDYLPVDKVDNSMRKSSTQTSLSDLVSYFGKKLFNSPAKEAPPPKPPRTYKTGVTNYQFEGENGTSYSSVCSNVSSTSSHSYTELGGCASNLEAVRGLKESGSGSTPSVNSGEGTDNTTASVNSAQEFDQSNSGESNGQSTKNNEATRNQTMQKEIMYLFNLDQSSAMNDKIEGTNGCTDTTDPVVNPQSAKSFVVRNNAEEIKNNDSLSRTANFFRRKLGSTLFGMFDRFSGVSEKKSQGMNSEAGSKNDANIPRHVSLHNVKALNEENSVKRSASAVEFPKKQVQALCHCIASEPAHLSFNKGSLLSIIQELDADWLLCSHGDTQGLVHRDCVGEVKKL